jgi:hypothetical protein
MGYINRTLILLFGGTTPPKLGMPQEIDDIIEGIVNYLLAASH